MLAIVGTDAALEEYQSALAKAEGMPRRGAVVGGPDYLPKAYYPGAPGWTARVANVMDTADGKRALEVPEPVRRHLGKTILVGAKNVALPLVAALLDVARKLDPESPIGVQGKAI